MITRTILLFLTLVALLRPGTLTAQQEEPTRFSHSLWHWSIQYLGITYHPDGGNTPEVYPLKLEKKAYLVLDVGVAANLDYSFSDHIFVRLTSSIYKECAFVTAGCLHTGPRLQYTWGNNSINIGIGPIFSFRQDWHRFAEYQDDEFYGTPGLQRMAVQALPDSD